MAAVLDLTRAPGAPDAQECRIQAMDRSHDGSKLIVGGQNMLRLISLTDGRQLAHGATVRSTKHKAQHHAVSALKFHPSEDLVASASSNASVVLWHLGRMGGGGGAGKMAEVMTKEHGGHQRAVHSLSWHPTKEKLLLTGSQDTTMKLWDLREPRAVTTTFTGRVAVRDVQFHPGNYENLFIAGLENGQVQVWDIRKITPHIRKTKRDNWAYDSDAVLQNEKNRRMPLVQAHDYVFSVQWHPTEKDCFASSGRDGLVHCWDLSKDIKNPVKTIKNMDFGSSVSKVAWRP